MIIGHYSPAVFAKGGIGSYIRRLGAAQHGRGDSVLYFTRNAAEVSETCTYVADDDELFAAVRRHSVDILHLHKEIDSVPPPSLPVVRTMHGNQASCPSGSRYLARSQQVCNRQYSKIGCTWGHLVDKCGSSKPARIQAHFDRIEKEKRVLPSVQTLTVSEFLRKNMIREGYPAERVRSFLSPAPQVDDDPVSVPGGQPARFVFLGRIVPQKGIQWLIQALRHVSEDVVVDIAGDGYFLESARNLAVELGVNDRTNFLGWVDGVRAADLIRASRGVIFPSVWHEPAGLVTLEAAAHSRPVITAKVGGIPEYADTSFAILVEPHDDKGLAAAIDRLSADRDLADAMGKAGYDYVSRKHSFEPFVESLNSIYSKIIESVNQ